MAGFLSTLRGGCKALFRSFTSTLSTVKKWFQHEITPIIQEIASFVHHLYHNYVRSFASQAFQFASDHLGIAIGLFCITVMACLWIMTTPSLYTLGFTILVSLAALAQSIIGMVPAGSIFAIFQSAGMADTGLFTLNGITVGIAALILLAVVVRLIILQRMEREKRKEGESEKERNKAF